MQLLNLQLETSKATSSNSEVLQFIAFSIIAIKVPDARLADVPAAVAASPLRNELIVLLLVSLGIKAGLVPLHVWLPLAHPVAPTPASAVLSGAMIKAGLLGWLRFIPFGLAAWPEAGHALIARRVSAWPQARLRSTPLWRPCSMRSIRFLTHFLP